VLQLFGLRDFYPKTAPKFSEIAMRRQIAGNVRRSQAGRLRVSITTNANPIAGAGSVRYPLQIIRRHANHSTFEKTGPLARFLLFWHTSRKRVT